MTAKTGKRIARVTVDVDTTRVELYIYPEVFRLVAYSSLVLTLASGFIWTRFVLVPAGKVSLTNNTLYEHFGYNNACLYIDDLPVKYLAMFLSTIFSISWLFYDIFFWIRMYLSHRGGRLGAFRESKSSRLLAGSIGFRMLTSWSMHSPVERSDTRLTLLLQASAPSTATVSSLLTARLRPSIFSVFSSSIRPRTFSCTHCPFRSSSSASRSSASATSYLATRLAASARARYPQ